MKATHPLQPEAVMAYLDGETTPAEASDIGAHLAACESCRQLAADLRHGSQQLREWRIADPPASLVAPAPRRTNTKRPAARIAGDRLWRLLAGRPLLAGAAAVVLIAAVVALQPSPKASLGAFSTASSEPADSLRFAERIVDFEATAPLALQGQQGQQGQQGGPRTFAQAGPAAQGETRPRIVRTATIRIVASDFDRIRPAVDRILQGVGGFVGNITAYDKPGSTRSIRGTLRIPSAQFSGALAQLRALGRVTEDSQNAEDVTAAVVDLDVRLANGRVTEKRLSEVLLNRTGRVADVLEVEREIARVRTEIEQLEAQRTQLDRRIEYATVTLEVVEERAVAGTLGTVPIPTRLRHAIADGIESAAMSMLDVTLFALRAGPVTLLWMIVLGLPAWWIIRRQATRPAQRPGAV